ncbi:MAG TPA: hypothetical protein VF398_09210 [bacterium]|jgi:hypothetical protein
MPELIICVDRRDFPYSIPHPFYLPDASPVALCGPKDLLDLHRLTILNSRQSPRISRTSKWIEQTLKILRQFDPRHTALVSSLGMTTWDFLTWAGGRMGFPIILIFPAGSAQNFNVVRTKAIMDLGLDDAKVLALRPIRAGLKSSPESDSALRDRWIIALTHWLIPISVRPGGHIEKYLSHADLNQEHVERNRQIPFEKSPVIKKPVVPKNIIIPESYRAAKFLIHWTRSCVGPWPGESRNDYFARIMDGDDEAGSGLEALQRILQEGKIRASAHLIRGGYPVVPFTECPPEDLPKLISWRAGLRRWTLEPYGFALGKLRLIELGARPVIYGTPADFERLEERDQPFFQMADSRSGYWRDEREWRIMGDVNLRSFAMMDGVIFLPSAHESGLLTECSRFRIIPLTED